MPRGVQIPESPIVQLCNGWRQFVARFILDCQENLQDFVPEMRYWRQVVLGRKHTSTDAKNLTNPRFDKTNEGSHMQQQSKLLFGSRRLPSHQKGLDASGTFSFHESHNDKTERDVNG